MSEQVSYFPPNLGPSEPGRGLGAWKTVYPKSLAALADEVAKRLQQPVDNLEIAAQLESMGIGDQVAADRYGAPDVFRLAEAVLDRWKETALPLRRAEPVPQPRASWQQAVVDYAGGPMALATVAVLLLIIYMVGRSGQFGQSQVLAMSLGMTGSLLVTNGFVQAASRRGSIYLSRGSLRSAGQYLWTSMRLAGICVLVSVGLVVVITARLGLFTVEDRLIFAFSFITLSAVWLMAAILALVQVPGWLALGLAASLVAGLIVDRAVSVFSGLHLPAAAAAGFVVAMALMLRAARRALGAGRAAQQRATLPTAAYLVHEAAAYFAYGTLYLALVLLPHVLGWAGLVEAGRGRMWAVSHLEAGLTLSLVPILLTGGVAEHCARVFWDRARAIQKTTPGQEPERFGGALFRGYAADLALYLAILAAVSLASYAGFEAALARGLTARWPGVDDRAVLEFIFRCGLLGYWLLGWGLFNCILSVSLARPELALQAVLLGMIVTVALGLPGSLAVSFLCAPAAFVAGAFMFGAASTWIALRLLRSADYYYFSSF